MATELRQLEQEKTSFDWTLEENHAETTPLRRTVRFNHDNNEYRIEEEKIVSGNGPDYTSLKVFDSEGDLEAAELYSEGRLEVDLENKDGIKPDYSDSVFKGALTVANNLDYSGDELVYEENKGSEEKSEKLIEEELDALI